MSAEKTKSESLTMEERLKTLYHLQAINTEIDRIKALRGELPLEVKDTEDQIEGLNTRIRNYSGEIDDLTRRSASEKAKIEEAHDKIAKYKEQLDNVRNNREYDLLTKEIEFQSLEIELAEKHLNEFARIIDTRKAEISATQEKLEDQNHILADKRKELEQIISETKVDEERLTEQALALEPSIDERTLKAFKRVRENARNGLAVVTIQRDACGGCFNRIPPQKQLEIRMHKKIIVCEYCGRIIIDPELTDNETEA